VVLKEGMGPALGVDGGEVDALGGGAVEEHLGVVNALSSRRHLNRTARVEGV
jgi:hypothetical protein